ncbi:MAG: tetratricopeptide repeat protein [Chitinophagaceae bacterium]|nr:MAG: tetratricopeptide repeat protein [Chitinophagaceae bacterium]
MEKGRLNELIILLKENPNDPFLKFGIAMEHLKSKNYPESLKFFQDLVDNHPDYSGTYFHMGQLYERMGKEKKAMEVYQKGMKVTKRKKEMKDYEELKEAFFLLMEDDDDDF